MCDCSQERDEKTVRKPDSQTITIFSKCQKPYRPGRDMLSLTGPPDSTAYIASADSLQASSCVTPCESAKISSTSTKSSSESSRTYKFVSPEQCECVEIDEGAEEVEEEIVTPEFPTPICVQEIKRLVERQPDIEYTLAIIKPEAVIYRKEIERRIYMEGFQICQMRWLQLTPEQVSEFYSDHFGELSFPHLVVYMSSGPIAVFVLAKKDAVTEWKRIIGPTTVTEARLYFPDSIRARYGRKGDSFKNAVHGSCSCEQAEKEIHFFFPEFIVEPLLRDEKVEDFLCRVVNPILIEGLTLCCKTRPDDPVVWLAHWLILNNPNKPKLPEDLALIPT